LVELKAPTLQRLYLDWDSRRCGREFPSRADFDPCDLTYVLGNLSLLDVLRNPVRFRYRLHASKTATRIGVDLTGKFVDQIPDRAHAKLANEHCLEVLDSRTPVVKWRHHQATDHRVWNSEILVLPLSNTGSDIDMLMNYIAWGETQP
jgi:hypothetical protein